MPSLTFSLLPEHADLIRAASLREQVSQSRVVRRALDLYFPECGCEPEREDGHAGTSRIGAIPAMSRLIRELASLRRDVAEMRSTVRRIDACLSYQSQAARSPIDEEPLNLVVDSAGSGPWLASNGDGDVPGPKCAW